MKQVKNRELPMAKLVSRWSINMHAAKFLERFGIVSQGSHSAVRDIPRVHEIGTGNVHETPDVIIGFAGSWIARVDYRYPIHVEIIPISACIDWSNGHFPDPISPFAQFPTGSVSGNIAGRKFHSFGFRRQDTEGDATI